MNLDRDTLVALTADIVAAYFANHTVSVSEVPVAIGNVYAALEKLGAEPEPAPQKPKPAVSVRASIKRDHLVSMIDGKPYKMLRRHLAQNGHTPESYREAFGLPHDYPMVAASYAETRRNLAKKIGLGRMPRTPKSKPTPS